MNKIFKFFTEIASPKSYSKSVKSFIYSEEIIYSGAELKEGSVGGRRALKRTDIDINQKEPWAKEILERPCKRFSKVIFNTDAF